MRILIGALFALLASSASAQAAQNNWTVGHGATGANTAMVQTTRSGETFEVGVYCYDPETVYMYVKGFPFPTTPGLAAQVYVDDLKHFMINMSVAAGGVPNGFATAPLVRELIVGLEMQVQFNGVSANFSLIGSARSLRNALRTCFNE